MSTKASAKRLRFVVDPAVFGRPPVFLHDYVTPPNSLPQGWIRDESCHKSEYRNRKKISFAMWRQHAFAQRVKALSMACLSSTALVLFFVSGQSCSYMEVNPAPGRSLMTSSGKELPGVDMAHIGLTCDYLLLDNGTDEMMELSQHFFYLSLGIGGATAVLAWLLSLWIQPTKCSWITMAIMGSVAAVTQVPIFLMYESIPCTMDVTRQTCSLGQGAYFNIVSIAFWIAMTLWAQCIRPPQWEGDIEASRTPPKRERISIQEIVIHTDSVTMNEDENEWTGNTVKQTKGHQDVESGMPGNQERQSASMKRNRNETEIIAPIPEISYNDDDDISEMTSGQTERIATQRKTGKSASVILNDLDKISA
jgi:hypothetical protein